MTSKKCIVPGDVFCYRHPHEIHPIMWSTPDAIDMSGEHVGVCTSEDVLLYVRDFPARKSTESDYVVVWKGRICMMNSHWFDNDAHVVKLVTK